MAKGSIRDPDAYVRAALRRRTERFDTEFPRNISFGDIDSFVEINGHFLILEWKVADQDLKNGQRRALRLVSCLPFMSVWILWTTEDGFITHGMRLGVHHNRVRVNEEIVRQRLRDWIADAEASPGMTLSRKPHVLRRHGADR